MGVPILIGTYWMQCIEFGLSFFSGMFVEPNRIVRLLMVLKKTDKNIVVGWHLWLVYMTNIYWCGLSWKDMSTKEHRYKFTLKREFTQRFTQSYCLFSKIRQWIKNESFKIANSIYMQCYVCYFFKHRLLICMLSQ